MKRDTEKTRDIRVLSNKRYRNSDHQEFFIKFESGLSVIGERTQSLQAHRDFELYFREDYIFNGYLRKSFLEELRTNKAKIKGTENKIGFCKRSTREPTIRNKAGIIKRLLFL